MVFVLNCLGFLALCCILALVLEEPLVKMMPAAVSIWILILYLLALLRCLHWIDGVCVLCLAALAVLVVRRFGREAGRRLADLVFSSEALALYLVLAAAMIPQRDIAIGTRDSVGCWALEVKSIAYFDGFAPIFKNAAIEFGSYAPGTTLFRWWTWHILPAWGEGKIAVGAVWLFVLLLAPLLSPFRSRRVLAPLLGLYTFFLLLLLPGIVDLECYETLCAELPITAVYVQALCALLDKKDRATMPRLAAALFCMCFFKSSGIAYALSLIGLLLLLKRFAAGDGDDCAWKTISVGQLCLTAGLCLIPSLSWSVFCRLTARSSYFKLFLPGEGEDFSDIWDALGRTYAGNLVKGTVLVPLHEGNAIINLTLLVVLIGFGLLFWLLARSGRLTKRAAAVCALYFCGLTAILYLTLFIMHTFVFREPLYFSPECMLMSVTRYGHPILVGCLLLLAYLFLSRGSRRRRLCAAAVLTAVVLLCSPLGTIRALFFGRENTRTFILEGRAENCALFENCLQQRKEIPQGDVRILLVYYMYSDYMPSRRYLQYQMVPDSILTYEVLRMEAPADAAENIRALAREKHAEYLYCCDLNEDLLDALSQGETIENDRLYALPQ